MQLLLETSLQDLISTSDLLFNYVFLNLSNTLKQIGQCFQEETLPHCDPVY
jgi:hypothetical protein